MFTWPPHTWRGCCLEVPPRKWRSREPWWIWLWLYPRRSSPDPAAGCSSAACRPPSRSLRPGRWHWRGWRSTGRTERAELLTPCTAPCCCPVCPWCWKLACTITWRNLKLCERGSAAPTIGEKWKESERVSRKMCVKGLRSDRRGDGGPSAAASCVCAL